MAFNNDNCLRFAHPAETTDSKEVCVVTTDSKEVFFVTTDSKDVVDASCWLRCLLLVAAAACCCWLLLLVRSFSASYFLGVAQGRH